MRRHDVRAPTVEVRCQSAAIGGQVTGFVPVDAGFYSDDRLETTTANENYRQFRGVFAVTLPSRRVLPHIKNKDK